MHKSTNASSQPLYDSWGLCVLDILQGLGPLMGLCSDFQGRIDFPFPGLTILL